MKKILLTSLFLIPFFYQSHAQYKTRVRRIEFASLDSIFHLSNDTTYVVNFWATWCKPCIEELPNFERLNSESKGKKLRVILVTLDMKKDITSVLFPFLEKNKIKSEVWMLDAVHANDWIEKVSPEWSGAIPATTFTNGTKKYQLFKEGTLTYDELLDMVKKLK